MSSVEVGQGPSPCCLVKPLPDGLSPSFFPEKKGPCRMFLSIGKMWNATNLWFCIDLLKGFSCCWIFTCFPLHSSLFWTKTSPSEFYFLSESQLVYISVGCCFCWSSYGNSSLAPSNFFQPSFNTLQLGFLVKPSVVPVISSASHAKTRSLFLMETQRSSFLLKW